MNLDTQRALDFLEDSGNFYFVDSESRGFHGDYGQIHVISIKPFGEDPISFTVGANLQDKGTVKDAAEVLNTADCWVTFYGKGHDIPLINTRLTRWGYKPLDKILHLDMYYQLKYKLKTSRKSQAHMLEFLEDTMEMMGIKPEKKMSVSPNVWADLSSDFAKNIKILKERCESDVVGLESLYMVTRQLIKEVTR